MANQSIFFKPKNRRLAEKISITSPTAFRKSIRELAKNGLTLKEKKALVVARTRSKLQLKRKDLSPKERKQFKTISKMNIPKVTK